ncbi:MAG: TspO/MBR family protein [Polymorphobacter sp.]
MTTPINRGSAFRAAIILVPLFELLGGLMARVSGSTETNLWFLGLTLPLYQPPGPVFGIVWSILYALMAIAVALVWAHKSAPGRSVALLLFAAQLLLNLGWSPLFFNYHQILPSLGLIGAIFALALATTLAFGRISRAAAWLMVPYLAWLGVAAALNFRIWQLNPGASAALPGF